MPSRASRSAPASPASTQKGTEHGDELTPQGFLSNNAGGVLGGISTGQDVWCHGDQADLEHPPAAPLHRQGRAIR
jgi:hypothetical protein